MAADLNHDGGRITAGRLMLYALLVLVALYYLAPLYVMLTTSVW
jgi:glucose/mannose transport system permease protein